MDTRRSSRKIVRYQAPNPCIPATARRPGDVLRFERETDHPNLHMALVDMARDLELPVDARDGRLRTFRLVAS